MSSFFRRLLEHKKNILISIFILFVAGFIFGFFEYQFVSKPVQNFFQNLFYLNKDGYTNQYQMFVLQNAIYIFICTYISTSYLGCLGIMIMTFLKGLQISFSLIFLFSVVPFSLMTLFIIIIEIILEILLCFFISYMCMYISLYVLNVTFFVEQNFNIKSMINYKLNCLIVSLVIFCLSLAFRIYLVPLL